MKSLQLMQAVRLRRLAMSLGIEKLILKQDKMITYFIPNSQSAFYDSKEFSQIMNYINYHPKKVVLKQDANKLSLNVKSISSVDDALKFWNDVKSYV